MQKHHELNYYIDNAQKSGRKSIFLTVKRNGSALLIPIPFFDTSAVTLDSGLGFSVSTNSEGQLIVREVYANSDASEKDVREGDHVVRADNRTVATSFQLRRRVEDLQKYGKKSVTLGLRRDDRSKVVTINLAELYR